MKRDGGKAMSSLNETSPQAQPPHPPKVIRQVSNWSLRAELLASHLLLVTIVVLALGTSIYWLVRQATYRQAESELLGAAQLLAQDLNATAQTPSLAISQAYRHRFGAAPRDHAYFVVWDASGQQIAGSDPLPPHVMSYKTIPIKAGPKPFEFQTHGSHLDVIMRGPNQSVIMIGRPLAKEFDQLNRLAAAVVAFGALCLLVSAAGVWWLARRIVSPLERLTDAAEQITAKNLDQDLQLTGASSEVMRLGNVFNGMLERLREAFQRQMRFTADASHELRTPVAVILSQSEQTLLKPRTPEEYQLALETCLRSARRMKRLVDDLLYLARADAGQLEIRHENVDLADITRQALDLLEPLIQERQIRVISQLQATPIQGDTVRLAQVVTNLVTNALQYNRTGGEVFVTVHARGGTASLIVADTGIGIPAASQPRLFERFYRADAARTHVEGQGTGLGLSLVAEIVAAHAGKIDITSEFGVGTTVTVELPVASRNVGH